MSWPNEESNTIDRGRLAYYGVRQIFEILSILIVTVVVHDLVIVKTWKPGPLERNIPRQWLGR